MATIDELSGPLAGEMMRLVARWLGTRGMAPMAFLVRIELFTFLSRRRCFVAEQNGKLVAFAALVPVPARGGWFLEDLVRDPGAPNGTAELLVDAVMSWAATLDCAWLTLGLAPLAGNVNAVLRIARGAARRLYDFEGVRAFKAKLRPKAWLPMHLSHPAKQVALASHLDVLAAFAADGLLSFGLRSTLRRQSVP